ncbi:hypothetical protein HYU95_05425 [Candidatus Daviesbacteria bacterium]|nr:hypothetical protein [Candidatus Daviesbacteria bacterium]
MDKPITALSFEFLTPFFDFLSNTFGFGKKFNALVANLLKIKSDERLVDVGFGTGSLLIAAESKYPKY